MAEECKRVTIFYGSQTGNAESISKDLCTNLNVQGFLAEVLPMNGWKKMETPLSEIRTAVFVCSTTGNGDPPENCDRFWRFLKRKTQPKDLLAKMKYTVLALGDTNYDKFCYMGKSLNTRLRDLGASSFYPLVCADEGTGMEEAVEGFLAGLPAALSAVLSAAAVEEVPLTEKAAKGPVQKVAKNDAPQENGGGNPSGQIPFPVYADPAPSQSQMASLPEIKANCAPSASISTPKEVTIMYGSQTGNAESIAKDLNVSLQQQGFESTVYPMNSWKKMEPAFTDRRVIVFVVSTTGNAEPPENCDRFWRFLKRKTQPKDMLKGLQYTVLGLGDTNYDKFCYMGKSLHARLKELGAVSFYPLACADEGTDLHGTVEPYLEGLPYVLNRLFAALSGAAPSDEAVTKTNGSPATPAEPIKTSAAPAEPTNTAAQARITSSDPAKEVNIKEAIVSPCSRSNVQPLKTFLTGTVETPPESDLPPPRPLSSAVELSESPLPSGRLRSRTVSIDGPRYNNEHPYPAKVRGARYLTEGGRSSDRRVIHLELNLGNSGIRYQPGDAIGIKCPNDALDVEFILARLEKFYGRDIAEVHLKPAPGSQLSFPPSWLPCTTRYLLTNLLDLTSPPRPSVLRALADCCSDAEDRTRLLFLSSKSGLGKVARTEFVETQRLSMAELLECFVSCTPSLDTFLSLLPALPPRYYSIACSQLARPSYLCVAFSVAQYSLGKDGCVSRRGLCTNWLESILQPHLENKTNAQVPEISIPIFVRPTKEFFLPGSTKWPIILVGPGTGVAPFIGFLEHRAAQKSMRDQEKREISSGLWRGNYEIDLEGEGDDIMTYCEGEGQGESWLFFGNRHQQQDWLYQKEMENFIANGTLTNLELAFSRDGPTKLYVQDMMAKNGKQLCSLITEEGAYVYICGDGNEMANDVDKCLQTLLTEHSGMETSEEVEDFLQDLKRRQRYVLDVWS
mmetsp:Transcript_23806/g.31125  ORF Transcript_23806/g.31125 Transcript_23806/m.31125 type:complete len:961 (-) Transcript_23806:204-3086(-)